MKLLCLRASFRFLALQALIFQNFGKFKEENQLYPTFKNQCKKKEDQFKL